MYTEADEYQILTGKLLPVDVRTLIDTGSQIEMKNGSLLIDTKKMVDEKFTHIKLEIDTTEWLLREVTMFIGPDDPFRIIYQYTTFEKQPVYKSITIIMGAMGVQTYNFSKYRKIHDPRRKFFQLK
jgi:hypothetical protein